MVYQLDQVRRMYRDSRTAAVVIPNAYVADGHGVSSPAVDRQPVVACAVARWDDSKGIETLLRAFALVTTRLPDHRLRLLGPDGGVTRYSRHLDSLCIRGLVDFAPMADDLAVALRDVSVFVLPSRHEGIPNALLEVMGVGVPAVACDCPPGGPRMVTDNGRRACLVPVDDPDAMAAAILGIILDPDRSRALSRAAMEVQWAFDQESIGRSWALYFRTVLSRGPLTDGSASDGV